LTAIPPELHTHTIELAEPALVRALIGQRSEHLGLIAQTLELEINVHGQAITVSGSPPDVKLACNLIQQLYTLVGRGYVLAAADVKRGLNILASTPQTKLDAIFLDTVHVSPKARGINPRTPNQKLYVDAIRKHEMVFGVGPAGTGKTFLAVAMALAALNDKSVKRIVLTRPAVEAGEKLGFLPGDLQEKINPYLRPMLDALNEMSESERLQGLMERGALEIAPLAFMRGRTLSDAFIILDEAQNTTREQMKMFLTRMGPNSRMVINGDITQIDLPQPRYSGLIEALHIVRSIDAIGVVEFTDADVVRHSLVQRIIRGYEAHRANQS
jgi:phosphate starvation-inducible PhoH-like protein